MASAEGAGVVGAGLVRRGISAVVAAVVVGVGWSRSTWRLVEVAKGQ